MFGNLFRGLLICIGCYAANAWAILDIEITEGVEGAQPVAIVPFDWVGTGAAPQVDISAIVTADLRRTGKFRFIPEKDFLERPHHGGEVNFENWRALGVESLVVGRIRAASPGNVIVQFQLFDIYKRSGAAQTGPGEPEYKIKQLAGYNLPAQVKDLRRTAHYISDIVYEALTGERGAFTTRIAYVTATGEGKKTEYTLQVADMDGYNPYTVLRSSQPIMSPAWSPDARQLAYVSFENKKSQIYIQELSTGKRNLVSSQKGINGAPAWSPDGNKLAMALSRDGNVEIYIMELAGRRLRRLTNNTAIDTEPSWAPDGKSLVFVSDRSGKPQVYRIPVEGGRATRVTFQGIYNARPSFSPDGKSLVMMYGDDDGFHIARQDLDTGVIHMLSKGSEDESPSFAPNGSMVLYAASDGTRGILSAVSVDGKAQQRLKLQQGDVREPAWAPYFK